MESVSYKCVRALKVTELEDSVNKLIAEGYRPLGGISHDVGLCYQAMLKTTTLGENKQVEATIMPQEEAPKKRGRPAKKAI